MGIILKHVLILLPNYKVKLSIHKKTALKNYDNDEEDFNSEVSRSWLTSLRLRFLFKRLTGSSYSFPFIAIESLLNQWRTGQNSNKQKEKITNCPIFQRNLIDIFFMLLTFESKTIHISI
jgi:hypothetical protein